MPSETTLIRVNTEEKDALAALAKKEGLSMAGIVAHVVAAYLAPKPVEAPASGSKGRFRGKVTAPAKGSRSDAMRAQREAFYEELESRVRVRPKVMSTDCCRVCQAPKGEYHNSRCLGSLAGRVVYEGRDERLEGEGDGAQD